MLKRSGCFTQPNRWQQNKETNSSRWNKNHWTKQIIKSFTNPRFRSSSCFFRPNTSDPQPSPPCHYQGPVPAIGTFGPLGLGWRWRIYSFVGGGWVVETPKNWACLGTTPPPSKSHQYRKKCMFGRESEKKTFICDCSWGGRPKAYFGGGFTYFCCWCSSLVGGKMIPISRRGGLTHQLGSTWRCWQDL